MTLTETEIFARLTALHRALVEKLGAQPFLAPDLRMESGGKCRISIYSPYIRGDYECLHTSGSDTIVGAFDGAEAFVAAMPDPEAKARRDWHRKLGNVIDEGHALALPDDVMTPLRASSQAMHKNLLAAPSAT
jgi:hypothetical protein